MRSMQDRINEKLTNMFKPVYLVVVNESHLHKGHSGDDGSGESHFHVEVVSDLFGDKRQVVCHRMVYDCLSEEMKCVHSLSVYASAHKK